MKSKLEDRLIHRRSTQLEALLPMHRLLQCRIQFRQLAPTSTAPRQVKLNKFFAKTLINESFGVSGVDPYISGSNNVDTTGSAVSAASAAAAVSQAASSLSNLAASASSNSYASDGYADSHYGSSSGSYGSTGGTYGSSAGSYGGSTGLASYGSSGGGSYGSGGGGGYGGGGGGGYGGGGGNTYTTVTIPGSNQGLDKANALNFLSSLAPSLLLSSLLLPLALAILSNATGALGRRKRGVDSYFDDIEIEDQIDFDVSFLDDNTLKTIDAIIETLDSSSDQSTEQQQAVITFASKRGLFDTGNQCLDKLACLSAEGSKSTLVDSKEASKLRK